MTKYVKTDYDGCPYITAGKWYEFTTTAGTGGKVTDDDGDSIYISTNHDMHLNGHDWTVSDTKPLTIEAGKYYRTRDGRKVGPMVHGKDYWFANDNIDGYSPMWLDDGMNDFFINYSNPEYDLIAEWKDEPTLWRDMTPEEKGALLLAKHEGQGVDVWSRTKWVGLHYAAKLEDYHAYRIAPPKPVVETVEMGYIQKGNYRIDHTGSTHRITFNTVDGVPDCGSVKMEEV